MMQHFCKDNVKVRKFFSSINCGDHLVIIPNGKKAEPENSNNFEKNEAEHFLVFYIDENNEDEDEDEIISYVVEGTLINHIYPDEQFGLTEDDILVLGTITPGMWTTTTNAINITHKLTAEYDESADKWQINLFENDGFYCLEYNLNCVEIHDIVNFSGEMSIPTLCAKACAKRAYRMEKTTFSTELTRPLGNILAADLAEMMYPEIDIFVAGHSHLNRPY